MKAASSIFGTSRNDVEQVAGFMYPAGGWDGYQVSVRDCPTPFLLIGICGATDRRFVLYAR
jgi:hypothetical protein